MPKINIFSPTIGSIFFIVGSGILCGGYFAYTHTQNFVKNASIATGTVIDLEPYQSKKSTLYTPVIKYKNNKGEFVQIKSNVSSSPPAYEVGQTVEVIYDPDNPKEAEVNSFWTLWFLSILLLGMGGIFTTLGLTLHVNKI